MTPSGRDDAFARRYGPCALVTGAARATGLGAAFADEVAGRGVDLLLCDVRGDDLERSAQAIRARHPVDVRTLEIDLGTADVLPALDAAADGREIGLLICNHTVSPPHLPDFLELDLAAVDRHIQVNARGYAFLMHAFGGRMVRRGRGGVIVVSSLASFVGSPHAAAYSATKAFQRNLCEAMAAECAGSGVDFLTVMPGMTDTVPDLFARAPRRLVMQADEVARCALRSLGRKQLVVPGRWNKLGALLMSRLLPRSVAIRMTDARRAVPRPPE